MPVELVAERVVVSKSGDEVWCAATAVVLVVSLAPCKSGPATGAKEHRALLDHRRCRRAPRTTTVANCQHVTLALEPCEAGRRPVSSAGT